MKKSYRMSAVYWENPWASFIFHRDNFQKKKTVPASRHPILTGPDVTCFSFFHSAVSCLGVCVGMMPGWCSRLWWAHGWKSSRRKNNMPLWISQNTTRSHNTTQHGHPPLAFVLLLLLSMNVLFLARCVFFLSLSSSLTLAPSYQMNRSFCRVPWVHSRLSGSSHPCSRFTQPAYSEL